MNPTKPNKTENKNGLAFIKEVAKYFMDFWKQIFIKEKKSKEKHSIQK